MFAWLFDLWWLFRYLWHHFLCKTLSKLACLFDATCIELWKGHESCWPFFFFIFGSYRNLTTIWTKEREKVWQICICWMFYIKGQILIYSKDFFIATLLTEELVGLLWVRLRWIAQPRVAAEAQWVVSCVVGLSAALCLCKHTTVLCCRDAQSLVRMDSPHFSVSMQTSDLLILSCTRGASQCMCACARVILPCWTEKNTILWQGNNEIWIYYCPNPSTTWHEAGGSIHLTVVS